MNLISKHKALIITTLITAIIVMLLFNLHISQSMAAITESYYELEPEEIIKEEKKELEEVITSSSKRTNLAFNETDDFKDLDDDYLEKVQEHYNKYAKATQSKQETEQELEDDNTAEKLTEYNKINDLLAAKAKNKQSNGDNSSEEISIETGANKNSTMSYSLVNRTHKFLPTPIYLCENNGKIVINITVNHLGKVTNTSVNGSSNSTNECLLDHAIEYAENARFSADASKKSQIGTITFSFKGKR